MPQRIETSDPILVFLEDAIEDVKNLPTHLVELESILRLVARVPNSERPATDFMDPVSATICICKHVLGKDSPLSVRIEKSMLPFSKIY